MQYRSSLLLGHDRLLKIKDDFIKEVCPHLGCTVLPLDVHSLLRRNNALTLDNSIMTCRRKLVCEDRRAPA